MAALCHAPDAIDRPTCFFYLIRFDLANPSQAFFHSNFLHFAVFFGYSCAALMVAVSLQFPPPPKGLLSQSRRGGAEDDGGGGHEMAGVEVKREGGDVDEGGEGVVGDGGEGQAGGKGWEGQKGERGEGEAVDDDVVLLAGEGGYGVEGAGVEGGGKGELVDERHHANRQLSMGLVLALMFVYILYR